MKKLTTETHSSSLPTDLLKRVDMVIAVCTTNGFVNREILAKYYGLSQLHASVLLRDFLQERVHDIRRDENNHGYTLVGYPKKIR